MQLAHADTRLGMQNVLTVYIARDRLRWEAIRQYTSINLCGVCRFSFVAVYVAGYARLQGWLSDHSSVLKSQNPKVASSDAAICQQC